MKGVYLFFFICIIVSCSTPRQSGPSRSETIIQTYIDSIKNSYAPDKRVALFDVSVRGSVVAGETNLPGAKAALYNYLVISGVNFVDSISIIPNNIPGNQHFAVATISVANLRSQPRHSAELSTQVTLGTPLNVLKKNGSWYLVQSPDKYLAWVDAGGIKLYDSIEYSIWKNEEKLIYTSPVGKVTAANDSIPVSDIVYGSVLSVISNATTQYEVRFPDGRTGLINRDEAMLLKDWTSSRQPTGNEMVASARQLMGLPYLWGGTSIKGVDCSGFTKTVYFMNGLVLPRDASQQVNIGEFVDTVNNWSRLREGDLLFFGVPAGEGKPERVVHVGMWIGGDLNFIHSSGRVRVSSMNPGSPQFDESELKRFLRAKRVSPSSALIDLRSASLFQ